MITHYLGSEFLGRLSAKEVLETFLKDASEIDKTKLLQVSSDGPNVNLCFLPNLAHLREEEHDQVLNVGTCGHHVVHGTLRLVQKVVNRICLKNLQAMWTF